MLRSREMWSASLGSALEHCEADPMMTGAKLGLEQDLCLGRGGTLSLLISVQCQDEWLKVNEKAPRKREATLKRGEYLSVQLWHECLLMEGPVRQFPEVVWTKWVTVVVCVRTVRIVLSSTCKRKRSSKHQSIPGSRCYKGWLKKLLVRNDQTFRPEVKQRRPGSYSATGPTACVSSILSALHSGSTGQCCWHGPLSVREKRKKIMRSSPTERDPTASQAHATSAHSVNPNVVYIEDGLVLLLLFWFGLPRPCRTIIPPIIISRQQAATTPAEAAPHCVVDSCLGSLLRVCPPSALALRWFWQNRVAKQRMHLQQHHVDVAVFLQICWIAATLRGTEESP